MKKIKFAIVAFALLAGSNINANQNSAKKIAYSKASDCARMARETTLQLAEFMGQDPNDADNLENYLAVYNTLYEGCYNS